MAIMKANAGAQVINLSGGIVVDGVDVLGGYFVVNAISDIPSYANNEGQLCFVKSENKYYRYNGEDWVDAAASDASAGFMSAEDKATLDTVAEYIEGWEEQDDNIIAHVGKKGSGEVADNNPHGLAPSDIGAEAAITDKKSAFNVDFETDAGVYKANGTAEVGTSSNVARADHVHPSDSTKLDVAGGTVGYLDVTGALTVTGATTIQNDLTVEGDTYTADIHVGATDAPAVLYTDSIQGLTNSSHAVTFNETGVLLNGGTAELGLDAGYITLTAGESATIELNANNGKTNLSITQNGAQLVVNRGEGISDTYNFPQAPADAEAVTTTLATALDVEAAADEIYEFIGSPDDSITETTVCGQINNKIDQAVAEWGTELREAEFALDEKIRQVATDVEESIQPKLDEINSTLGEYGLGVRRLTTWEDVIESQLDLSGATIYWNTSYNHYIVADGYENAGSLWTFITGTGGYTIKSPGSPMICLYKNNELVETIRQYENSNTAENNYGWVKDSTTLPDDFGKVAFSLEVNEELLAKMNEATIAIELPNTGVKVVTTYDNQSITGVKTFEDGIKIGTYEPGYGGKVDSTVRIEGGAGAWTEIAGNGALRYNYKHNGADTIAAYKMTSPIKTIDTGAGSYDVNLGDSLTIASEEWVKAYAARYIADNFASLMAAYLNNSANVATFEEIDPDDEFEAGEPTEPATIE
jgi:hypothetical protein